MAVSSMNRVMQRIRQVVVEADGPRETDASLLARFLSHRDARAVSMLISRHAPMVWGVCSRTLGHRQDAEDAFQATFLVLLRKANTIHPRSMVGNWLHGVAFQTALKARATAMKRSTREKPTSTLPEPPARSQGDHPMLAFLDEELSRLPDNYRVALVLCDLQGKTRAEAAKELGWLEGTVASRLARGRQMLAKRLGRHGTAVSAAGISALLAHSFVSAAPGSVVATAVQAATTMVAAKTLAAAGLSQQAIILAEGVVKTMLLSKLKIATAMLLSLAILGSGIGMLAVPAMVHHNGAEIETNEASIPKDKSPQTDSQKLHGAWTLVETHKHGERVAAKDIPIKPHKLVFDGNKIPNDPKSTQTLDPTVRAVVFHHDGGSEDGDVRLNATKNPKEITLLWFLNQWVGIYKVEGDALTICYNPKNNIRPGEFRTAPDADRVLLVYRREKADPAPKNAPGGKANAEVAPPSDMDKFQGSWVSVACEMNGLEFTGKLLKDYHFDPSFDGKKYVIQFGTIRMEGTFELKPTSNPKTITLKGTQGTNLGIYTFDGDQLRICVCDTTKGGLRPTEFKTKAGSNHTLFQFKRVPREDEVREVVDRFLKTALAGETEKVRALAAPAVSDPQLARFKGLAKMLPIANVYVTAGPAPTSYGDNAGRALVVTDEIEINDGNKKSKGRVMLTLLKDDERLETKGWLVWDIDLADDARIERAKKFIERTQGNDKPASEKQPMNDAKPRPAPDLELVVGKELHYRTKDNAKLRPVLLAGVTKLVRDGDRVVIRVDADVAAELVMDLIKAALERKQVSVTVLPTSAEAARQITLQFISFVGVSQNGEVHFGKSYDR